jgi:hypothetical protein
MKANEFLTEAGIIDRLKKKAPPERIEPTFDAPTKKSRKPRNPAKNAFGQMTSQLSTPKSTATPPPAGQQAFSQMATDLTPKPKRMRANKKNPGTAVGAKTRGGSPEYQAAQAQIQKNTQAQQKLTKTQAKPAAPKTAQNKVNYSYNQVPQPQTGTTTPSTPPTLGLDQNRLTRSVIASIGEITDPILLKNIEAIVSSKLTTTQP